MKDPIFVIQDCEKEDNSFNKADFVASINKMSKEDFEGFCQAIKSLTHYYHSTRGASVSDDSEFIQAYPDKFWRLSEIPL